MADSNKEMIQNFLKEVSKRKILIGDGLYVVKYDDLEKIAEDFNNEWV